MIGAMRAALVALACAACASGSAPMVHAPADGQVRVEGLAGEVVVIDAARMAQLPRASGSVDVHGVRHTFEGAPLAVVIALVNAPLGERLRGESLTTMVLVQARDGYRVVLSLAEIDPAMRADRVLLADTMDGAPIGAEDGPYRLVVAGDRRAARAVRQVERIVVRRAPE